MQITRVFGLTLFVTVLTLSILGKDKSSTIILVSPVTSSLLSNLTSSGNDVFDTLLSISITATFEEANSPLINKWAWILPVGACTETIAVAADELPPIILK